MSTALIILTLNEIDGVKNILPKIDQKLVDEILVVDGGSTDGTIEHVKKISKGGYPQYGKFKLRKFDKISKLYPNVQKAKNKINWRPKISFKKGLKSTIKFYNERAI